MTLSLFLMTQHPLIVQFLMNKEPFIYSLVLFLIAQLLLIHCTSKDKSAPKAKKVILETPLISTTSTQKQKLSDYDFFGGEISELIPSERVFPYSLNTPLFTDYAFKKRFIYLPEGEKISYTKNAVFNFGEGTILIKNFYYPKDFNSPEGDKKLIETRLLVKEENNWTPLNYIWDEEQKDAFLNYTGKTLAIRWTNNKGDLQQLSYNVPNNNQCKNCHLDGKEITPIGPTAAQLNKRFEPLSKTLTQLEFFAQHDYLTGFPQNEIIPQFSVWNDPETGTIAERAKTYLDINCAHCHQPHGSAKNSGLDLSYNQTDARKRGVFKPPVAAGKGSGNLHYSIVPGEPNNSILVYRMLSNDPGTMMPEIGRSTVHKEGVALITEYIKSLNPNPSK